MLNTILSIIILGLAFLVMKMYHSRKNLIAQSENLVKELIASHEQTMFLEARQSQIAEYFEMDPVNNKQKLFSQKGNLTTINFVDHQNLVFKRAKITTGEKEGKILAFPKKVS